MQNEKIIQRTIKLAEKLQSRSNASTDQPAFTKRLKPLLIYPKAKTFLIHLMDVAFRPTSYETIANFVHRIFSVSMVYKVLFTGGENLMVKLFTVIGYKFPSVSIPIMQEKIREVAEQVVFVHGSKRFLNHVANRNSQNVKQNVNLIGEALLGEEEAQLRLQQYLALLNDPSVNYVSVKVSTIFSQIDSLAYEASLSAIEGRLRILYDEVLTIHHKTGEWKFVNLDMEEYRDVSLTAEVFMKVLQDPKYLKMRAGIVLQAYLPDSYQWLIKIQAWAEKRISHGGVAVKIRVVKGANMEMEKAEASLHGWPLVTFDKKVYADAQYKKMLIQLLNPISCKSIHVGVASHNVFDIAFSLTLVNDYELEDKVDFEMLEGMAPALVDQVHSQGVKMLLYTPVVYEEKYMSAIAYLVRRLDEGTSDGNFLKEGFELDIKSDKWETLKKDFIDSVDYINRVADQPKRTQNRSTEIYFPQLHEFRNESDTDWVLRQNRDWIKKVLGHWETSKTICDKTVIPVVIAYESKRQQIQKRGWNGEFPWKEEVASEEDIERAIDTAQKSTWLSLSAEERISILREVAVQLRKNRGDLIGVGVRELGKLVNEMDSEVSEAIDFANYYAHSMEQLLTLENHQFNGKGVNLVLSPWNFPIAIPAGGVISSLVTGNTVILKPAPNAVASAYVLCCCFWDAGVPVSALQFIPTNEENLNKFLSRDTPFSAVILTGGTDTAKFLLKRNPHLPLYAETGGKNATIITALADKEQAVKNVIYSAFGNSGQKCSATSLLILEEEVFEDHHFKTLLLDVVKSWIVGSPFDLKTKMGPLAVPVNQKVKKAIAETSENEWLLRPRIDGHFMTPAIKWGARVGDFDVENELFAPFLSVICVKDLSKGIEIVNNGKYGLTSGLESLDEKEISLWKATVMVGNKYINRPTTGAIVQRQPFGGIKQSSFGFGMKAGGENYLLQFMGVSSINTHSSLTDNYKYWYHSFFQSPKDVSNIRGEDNVMSYLLPKRVVLTIDKEVSVDQINCVIAACEVLRVPLKIVSTSAYKELSFNVEIIGKWENLIGELKSNDVLRVLNRSRLSETLVMSLHTMGMHLYDRNTSLSGRVELLNYLQEISVSDRYHRYGNLMGRGV